MTKDVIVSVKGFQYVADVKEDESIETINRGRFCVRNGKKYVTYEEAIEGTTETNTTMLKFADSFLEVTKRGTYGSHLIFEAGRKNLTSYNTPFGNLLVGIDTVILDVTEHDNRILIHGEYKMEINYEYVADCKIDICIDAIKNDKNGG